MRICLGFSSAIQVTAQSRNKCGLIAFPKPFSVHFAMRSQTRHVRTATVVQLNLDVEVYPPEARPLRLAAVWKRKFRRRRGHF
jgi:hypothetical protein